MTTVCMSDKVLLFGSSAGVARSSFTRKAGAPFASAVLVSHALAQKDNSPYSQKPGPAYSDCPFFFARVEALCVPRGTSHLD